MFSNKKVSSGLSRDPVERIVSNYFYVRSPARWRRREVSPSQAWFTKNIDDCVRSNDVECQVRLISILYFISHNSYTHLISHNSNDVRNDMNHPGISNGLSRGRCKQHLFFSLVWLRQNLICCQIGVGGRSQEYQMRYFCERCDGKTPLEMMRIAMTTVESEYTVVGILEMFNSSLAVFQEYLPGNLFLFIYFILQLCLSNDLLLPRVIWTLAMKAPRFRIQLIALQNGSTEPRRVFPQLREILPTTTHTLGSAPRPEKYWEKDVREMLSFITLSSRGSVCNFLA